MMTFICDLSTEGIILKTINGLSFFRLICIFYSLLSKFGGHVTTSACLFFFFYKGTKKKSLRLVDAQSSQKQL